MVQEHRSDDRAGRFAELATARRLDTVRTLRREGVDCLELDTALPYLPPLLGFFRARERRMQ
ncbi:MAG: hypothetical protein ABI183_02490 [Polyangiaceae bacterium]